MSDTETTTKSGKKKRKKPRDQLPKRGLWRSNVEAWTVAIVITLVLKEFVIGAFEVPTESMEPTIIGRQSGGDRILVNRSAYLVKEPRRWDVAVFRYPMSRLVNYVKRVIGMPAETLKIVRGDIYTAPAGSEDFAIQRKPRGVQEEIFANHPVIPEEVADNIDAASFRQWWRLPTRGASLDSEEGTLTLEASTEPRTVEFRNPEQLSSERRDPLAPTRKGVQDSMFPKPVGDLRLELEVIPSSGATLIARIIDGSLVDERGPTPIVLTLVSEGGSGSSKLTIGDREIGSDMLSKLRLEADAAVEVRLDNVDDRVRVEIDGEEILVHDYHQGLDAQRLYKGAVEFGIVGGKARFTEIALYRDSHYTLYGEDRAAQDPEAERPLDTFRIPKGHYLFLGDNSPNSLDARDWRVVGIRLRETGEILLGDLEAVADDLNAPRQDNNPWLERDDPSVHHYLDIQGNHFRLEPGSYDICDLTRYQRGNGVEILDLHRQKIAAEDPLVAMSAVDTGVLRGKTVARHGFRDLSVTVHYVPRKDVLGQASLVFWPPSRWGVIR
jgi:signal peptidase I